MHRCDGGKEGSLTMHGGPCLVKVVFDIRAHDFVNKLGLFAHLHVLACTGRN